MVLAVKAAFDRAGLDIPWPIRTLDAAPSLRQALGADRGSEARPVTRETDDPQSPDGPNPAG